MPRKILVCASLIALAACGGGGKSALVDACVDEGEDKKDCACMADKLEEQLSPRAFEAVVLGATGKEEEAEKMMEDLGMAEAVALGGAMISVIGECGITGFAEP